MIYINLFSNYMMHSQLIFVYHVSVFWTNVKGLFFRDDFWFLWGKRGTVPLRCYASLRVSTFVDGPMHIGSNAKWCFPYRGSGKEGPRAKCRNWESSVVKGSRALGRTKSMGRKGKRGEGRVSEARIEVGTANGWKEGWRGEEHAIRRDWESPLSSHGIKLFPSFFLRSALVLSSFIFRSPGSPFAVLLSFSAHVASCCALYRPIGYQATFVTITRKRIRTNLPHWLTLDAEEAVRISYRYSQPHRFLGFLSM